MMYGRYSCQYKGAKEVPPVTHFPRINRWADIAFLEYQHQATTKGASMQNLKPILVTQIVNTQSQATIDYALGRTGQAIAKWPGEWKLFVVGDIHD